MTHILIIEDEASFSEAITFLLRKEGFEVSVANNGQSGLHEFEKNGADLILLDLMLPGLSGTEVCRQIRLKSSVPRLLRLTGQYFPKAREEVQEQMRVTVVQSQSKPIAL